MTTPDEVKARNDADDSIDAGPVSHDDARAILTRYNNGHWNNTGRWPIYSIPADPKRDDDLRLAAYIHQQRKHDEELRSLTRQNEAMREALERIRDDHEKDDDGGAFCVVCAMEGGRWPCATRLEAEAALTEGAKRE